jgi:hypothetical protein
MPTPTQNLPPDIRLTTGQIGYKFYGCAVVTFGSVRRSATSRFYETEREALDWARKIGDEIATSLQRKHKPPSS